MKDFDRSLKVSAISEKISLPDNPVKYKYLYRTETLAIRRHTVFVNVELSSFNLLLRPINKI